MFSRCRVVQVSPVLGIDRLPLRSSGAPRPRQSPFWIKAAEAAPAYWPKHMSVVVDSVHLHA